MDLPDLAQRLRSQVNDSGSFQINDATLGTSSVDKLIEASPLDGSSISVSADSIPDPSGGTLEVEGGTVSMLSLDGLSTAVTFKSVEGKIVFTLDATLPKNWSLASTFSGLYGSRVNQLDLDDALLVFTTEGQSDRDADEPDPGALTNGLNLSGSVTLTDDGLFSKPLHIFEEAVTAKPIHLRGPIQENKHGLGFSIYGTVPKASAKLGPVHLVDGFVGATLTYEKETSTVVTGSGKNTTAKTETGWVPAPTLEFGGHVSVNGKKIAATADVAGGDRLNFALTANHSLASLSDLAALLGRSSTDGKDWEAMLPDKLKQLGGFALRAASVGVHVGNTPELSFLSATVGLNDWTLLGGDVVAQQMRATWTVRNPTASNSTWSIDATAHATFGKSDTWAFDLTVDVPSLDVTADLVHENGQKYHVGGLVRDVLPGSVPVPSHLADVGIDDAYFAASPSSKSLHLHATGSVGFKIYDEDELKIEGLTFTFDYNGQKNDASGSLGGELAFDQYVFDVSAAIEEGMRFEGALPKSESVKVVDFLETIGTKKIRLPHAVPDFEVKALSFTAETKKKAFTFSGDVTTEWQVPLGAAQPSIELDFSVDSSVENGTRTFQGFVEGALDVGQAFDVRYEFGEKTSVLKGSWKQSKGETIGYKDFGNALDIPPSQVTTPKSGMPDLGLAEADLTIDFEANTVTLDAQTANTKLDKCSVFVRASKGATTGSEVTDTGWGFIFGADLNGEWKLGQLPAVGSHFSELNFISFTDAFLVIATRQEQLTGTGDLPLPKGASMEVVAGLNFGAHIDFSSASPPGKGRVGTLRHLIGGDEVFLQGDIARTPRKSSFKATLEGSVSLPITKQDDISIGDPFVRLSATPSLRLGGELKVPIPTKKQKSLKLPAASAATSDVDIKGYFEVNPEKVDFTVNARFHDDIKHPVGFQGVLLKDIGADVGITFEPTFGADFGLEAEFQIYKPGHPENPSYKSRDTFAFDFNVNPEEYFYPEYLYVKMSKLDLAVIFAAFVPNVDLPKSLGSGIRFTNAFVYFCADPETNCKLPDGTTVEPGFGFNGGVHVFDVFEGEAGVKISEERLHGDFEMTPVHLDVEGVTILSVTGNTSKGGPKVAFNTKTSPYLDVTADIRLLALKETLDVYLGNGKFTFAFQYQLVGEADLKLSCKMTDRGKVRAGGKTSVNLDLVLDPFTTKDEDGNDVTVVPKAHVRDDSAGIDVSLDADATGPHFSLGGGLDVHWHSINLSPHFTLSLQDIEHDLHNLWKAVVSWIESNLEAFYHDILKDLDRWAHVIETAFEDFAGDADKVALALVHYFDASARDAARILHDLEHDFETVVRTLVKYFDIAFKDAANIAKDFFGASCATKLAYTAVMGEQMTRHGPYYLAELAQTDGGQSLLFHYYLHEEELRTLLLGHNPAVDQRLIKHPEARATGVDGTGDASSREFAAGVLAVLDAVYPDASSELQEAIDTVRPLFDSHRNATFNEFVTALDEEDTT